MQRENAFFFRKRVYFLPVEDKNQPNFMSQTFGLRKNSSISFSKNDHVTLSLREMLKVDRITSFRNENDVDKMEKNSN